MDEPRVPTWEELVMLEPRLQLLLEEAQSWRHRRGPGYRWLLIWEGHPGYRGLKPRLSRLVGWFRHDDGDAILCTSAAYDVAYDRVCRALPPDWSRRDSRRARRHREEMDW